MIRIKEKSKVFTANKECKELEDQEAKYNEIINHYLKRLISIQIELEVNKPLKDEITQMKEIDFENTDLLVS
jgi:hypothetical protein